jgi:RhtB (resistance to homoserine/threonine) family protein
MEKVYLTQFITVIIVHFLAVASPGPDFLIVTKQSITSGRKIGMLTSLGVAIGILVHVTYCLLGIGLIISKSILIFNTIKYIGAMYLIYIGIKALRAKRKNPVTEVTNTTNTSVKQTTPWQAVQTGFLVNALNPKATLFFLALFTQVIDPQTPIFIQMLYGIEMFLATFIWFLVVAMAFSNHHMKQKISRIEHWIDRVSGAVLIALGIKIALSSKE